MDLVVDTNIAIYLLGGDTTVAALLDKRSVGMSFITELELLSYSGITQEEVNTIEEFVSSCVVVDLTLAVKRHAIAIRREYRLRLPDALVAATALAYSVPLMTADRQLERIAPLDLLRYDPAL